MDCDRLDRRTHLGLLSRPSPAIPSSRRLGTLLLPVWRRELATGAFLLVLRRTCLSQANQIASIRSGMPIQATKNRLANAISARKWHLAQAPRLKITPKYRPKRLLFQISNKLFIFNTLEKKVVPISRRKSGRTRSRAHISLFKSCALPV